jgi:hypothetical protein
LLDEIEYTEIVGSEEITTLVNVKTIDGVRVVCVLNSLPQTDIYSPTMLLERDDFGE